MKKICKNCSGLIDADAKYCIHCGAILSEYGEVLDVKPKQIQDVLYKQNVNKQQQTSVNKQNLHSTNTEFDRTIKKRSDQTMAALILMIINCVICGLAGFIMTISLAFINPGMMFVGIICLTLFMWMTSMTKSYNRKTENGEEISVAFKVCTLLFINRIAGILMLFDNSNSNLD